MQILLASNNEHKREEFKALMGAYDILVPKDIGLSFDCEETGSTFIENSNLKARELFIQSKGKYWVLSDDSGLLVTSLPGELGVHTARFGAKDDQHLLSAREKNELLLKKLEGKDRSARFVCCLTLMTSPYDIYTVQRAVEGTISSVIEGDGGFGYDPVFIINSHRQTMASLGQDVKNRIGHRAVAVRDMIRIIETIKNN